MFLGRRASGVPHRCHIVSVMLKELQVKAYNELYAESLVRKLFQVILDPPLEIRRHTYSSEMGMLFFQIAY